MMRSSSVSIWASCWALFAVFCCTWILTHARGQDSQVTTGKIMCNDTRALDVCWNKLPPVKDHGIPSNPQAVENACKVFDSGMECVDNWTRACLNKQEQEKVKSSVIGALETYRFLCTDKRFRRDFLLHADCYKRISHHWDECARKFIESLKRVDHAKDTLSLCCIRFRYLRCVTDVASHFCSSNATQFLQRLAESLVRSTMRSYHPSQCVSVSDRNCSLPSSAQSSTKFLSTSAIYSSLLYRILSSPSEWLINSLNVLQNLAFVDISTLFGALSRELSLYCNYHQRVDFLVGKEDVSWSRNPSSAPTTTTKLDSCVSSSNENNNNPV